MIDWTVLEEPVTGTDRWPEPATDALMLRGRPDGRLLATQGGASRAVSVRLTFPWTEPAKYLSLRDDDEDEFALVANPDQLDPASRAALHAALAQAGFVLEVTRVLMIEEEVEVRHWKVETRQGPRVFQTRLEDWPRALPLGGLLIRDVAGDLYHVPRPEALDPASRTLLWVFVD